MVSIRMPQATGKDGRKKYLRVHHGVSDGRRKERLARPFNRRAPPMPGLVNFCAAGTAVHHPWKEMLERSRQESREVSWGSPPQARAECSEARAILSPSKGEA
jgi:hypothetical protein